MTASELMADRFFQYWHEVVTPAWPASTGETLKFLRDSDEFREIVPEDGVAIDLRYASRDNFLGYDFYGPFRRLFLHKQAADKLRSAIASLRRERPGYKFILYDGLRPRSAQYTLWRKVAGTAQERYVADPRMGSIHNYGLAIDLSVLDETGRELDMGTGFDDFTPLAEPRLEPDKLAAGELTWAQFENRMILRRPMEEAGFKVLPQEWWHFDALPADTVRQHFKIVE
jgi:D-alanyl-D-alanine dipeptidase